jgi:hypothetical protein
LEPVLLLSKFFQLNVTTSHLVLIHLQARIAEMRQPKFEMCADISHSPMELLTGRNKTETVMSHDDVVSMEPCVARFRYFFADDLEIGCGLVNELEEGDMVEDAKELPTDIGVAFLMNQLVGGKSCVQY